MNDALIEMVKKLPGKEDVKEIPVKDNDVIEGDEEDNDIEFDEDEDVDDDEIEGEEPA